MRDTNRQKERFQLSLDGRQVASIVVGALVILGAVFFLGMSVGRQLGDRERLARRPTDPLAALDTPPALPDAGEPPKLSYHEELTKNRPPEPPRAPAPRPALAPPSAETKPSAAPANGSAPGASPGRSNAIGLEKPPLAAPSPGAESGSESAAGVKSPASGFAIQVGSTQDPSEAQRIADRFKGHKPRIVSADIPGKGRWYRVKVGSFDSRTDAERYLKDLSRETSVRGFVTSHD
jgi:DedD protein